MEKERGPDGGLTYEKVMGFLRSSNWPVTSTEVAEQFDISQQAAYYRLQKLTERGCVERKKSSQTVLWRPVDQNQSRCDIT